MAYVALGVLFAAVVVIAVVVLVRKSVTSGALGQFVVPYAEPDGSSAEFIGGGVWNWGVRASAPLVRLEVGRERVRIGPSSAAWTFLIPSLSVPRADLLAVEEIQRPFNRRAVRFAVVGDAFAFIGPPEPVLGAVAAHPPEDSDAEPPSTDGPNAGQ